MYVYWLIGAGLIVGAFFVRYPLIAYLEQRKQKKAERDKAAAADPRPARFQLLRRHHLYLGAECGGFGNEATSKCPYCNGQLYELIERKRRNVPQDGLDLGALTNYRVAYICDNCLSMQNFVYENCRHFWKPVSLKDLIPDYVPEQVASKPDRATALLKLRQDRSRIDTRINDLEAEERAEEMARIANEVPYRGEVGHQVRIGASPQATEPVEAVEQEVARMPVKDVCQ